MTLPTIPAIRMERVTVAEEHLIETIQEMHHLEGVTMDCPANGSMAVDIADAYFRMDCLRAAVQLHQGTGNVEAALEDAETFLNFIANPEPKE